MNGSLPLGGHLTPSMLFDLLTMCVGLTFAYSAIVKAINFRDLVHGLRVDYLFKGQFASLMAFALIVGETAIGVFHIGRFALNIVLPATGLLLTLFFVNVVRIFRQGELRPCLCFGADRADPVSVLSLVRVVLMLVIELALWWNYNEYQAAVTRDVVATSEVVTLWSASVTLTATVACLLSIPKFYRVRRVLIDV